MQKHPISTVLMLLIGIILSFVPAYADNLEGTGTSRDYLFILVHGINSDTSAWDGSSKKDRDKATNLKAYLENIREFKDRVYCYNFSKKNGDSVQQTRELGDRGFQNPEMEDLGMESAMFNLYEQ